MFVENIVHFSRLLRCAGLQVGPDRVLTLLEQGKQWLFANGDLLVCLVSLALAVYLGWQGIEGLRLG